MRDWESRRRLPASTFRTGKYRQLSHSPRPVYLAFRASQWSHAFMRRARNRGPSRLGDSLFPIVSSCGRVVVGNASPARLKRLCTRRGEAFSAPDGTRRKVVEAVCAVMLSPVKFSPSTTDCAGFAGVSLIASFFSQPMSVMHPAAIKATAHNPFIGCLVWLVPCLPE